MADQGLVVDGALVAWPDASVFRAPTDNDGIEVGWMRGVGLRGRWVRWGLDRLYLEAAPPTIRRVGDHWVSRREVRWHPRPDDGVASDVATGEPIVHRQRATVRADGSVSFDEDVLVPDLAGWRRERLAAIPDEAYFTLAPDWVCEVLSPSTARHDRSRKLATYAAAGIRHAWLVDPEARTLEVLRLADGRWTIDAVHAGNDPVQADCQDGSGVNNANFNTPFDGSSGRMQMYVFTGPTPDRDGDLDADIVYHEHTHGLSNRLVGVNTLFGEQSGGMGEGWSDFVGMCLNAEAGDDPNANYHVGGYSVYQFSGLIDNYYFGIRRFPYCTDMTRSPLTYEDIDAAQFAFDASIPRNPSFGPATVATSFIRNVYTLVHPAAPTTAIAQSPMAPALQIGRMDVPREVDAEWNVWYNTIYVPNYEKVPGVIRGRRFRAIEGTPSYMTVYEFEHPKVSESAAWNAQRDAEPVNERMRTHMRHAPGSPGVYVKTFEL